MEITLRRVLLLASLICITACSGTGHPSDTILPTFLPTPIHHENVTTGLCDNPFFPVRSGASWTYFNMGGPNGDFTYTDTITEIGTDRFVLTSQFPTLTLSQEWVCTAEGYIARQLGGGTTASVSMQNMITDFQTLEVSGVSLPRTISPNMQWQYDLTMQGTVAMPAEQTRSPGTFSLDMQEIGSETITVPAGTFEALKIQAAFNANIDVDFQGSPIRYTIQGSSILWYASEVGFIKSIENIDFSGTTFSSTTELQSHTLP